MRRRLLVVTLVAVGLLLAAQVTGLLDAVREPGRLRELVDDAGPLGPVVLVVLMTSLVPLGVPGVPFVIAAGALWPAPVAVGASLAGGMTSSWIGIVVARRVGREALRERLPRRLAGLDERLTRAGTWGVILLRVVLYLTAPADWLIGLSGIGLRAALVGTGIGLLPPTIGYVLLGGEFFRWLVTPAGLSSAAAGLAVAAGLWWWTRRRRPVVRSAGTPPTGPAGGRSAS